MVSLKDFPPAQLFKRSIGVWIVPGYFGFCRERNPSTDVAKYLATKNGLLANLVAVGVDGIHEGPQHIELFRSGGMKTKHVENRVNIVYICIYIYI